MRKRSPGHGEIYQERTEDLLEKEKKAEIKRKEKQKRRTIRAIKIATSSCFIPSNKHTLMMCEALKK